MIKGGNNSSRNSETNFCLQKKEKIAIVFQDQIQEIKNKKLKNRHFIKNQNQKKIKENKILHK